MVLRRFGDILLAMEHDEKINAGLWGTIRALVNIGKMEVKVEAVDFRMQKMERDVAIIKEFKKNTEKFIDHSLYRGRSPLSLTDDGEKLVRDSGLQDVLNDEKMQSDLLGMLKKKNPETRYDIQETAREMMDGLSNHDYFRNVKEYAFENGKDVRQILRAGSIILRDVYIEKVYNKQQVHNKAVAE